MSDHWKLLDSEDALTTKWLTVRCNRYELPSGGTIDDFYVLERSAFVLVVAQREGKILLVRQYRPGTERFYLGVPAGYVGDNESPEEAGLRELREETGLEGREARLIGVLDPLPGYIKSPAHVVTCEAQEGKLATRDAVEIESVREIPIGDCLQMIQDGEINEMQAVSAILLNELIARRHEDA